MAPEPLRQVWHRFRSHRLALGSSALLLLIAAFAVVGPYLWRTEPNRVYLSNVAEAPSAQHPLGTDEAGRDVLARVMYGGRVSLSVGLVAVGISTVIGVLLGGLAGYYGGAVDMLIMRFTDVVMCFPTFLILIAIRPLMRPSIFNIMLLIGLFSWTGIARVMRGQFLAVKSEPFVEAAIASGAPARRVMWTHIFPNAVAPVIVAATLGVANAILLEAGLSFLGLGVQQPTPTWGNIIRSAQSLRILTALPWLWLPPGLLIGACVLCINFVGDGLRDALDPTARHRT